MGTRFIHRDGIKFSCWIGDRAHAAYSRALQAGEPFRAYKFLKAADRKYWLDESSFIIRPWKTYADAEAKQIAGVADDAEGRHAIQFEHYSINQRDNPDDFARLEQINFISGTLGGELVMTSSRITRHAAPANVLCLGTEASVETRRRWLETEGYDAVIEITNLAKFVVELQLATEAALLNGVVDLVSYGPQVSEPTSQYFTGAPIFRKDDLFEWQNEIRIVWNDGREPIGEVKVRAPNTRALLRDVS